MQIHRLSLFAISAILCLFGLSGCITPAGEAQAIYRECGVLQGKPIKTAFDVLGYPDSKQDFGSISVYQWITNADPAYFQIKVASDVKTGIIQSAQCQGNGFGAMYYYPTLHSYYLSQNPARR